MKHLTMIMFFLITISSLGQSENIDQRLLIKFSQEEIKNMNEEELKFEIFCLDNSFTIENYSDNKEENDFPLNGGRKIENLNDISLEDLNIRIKEDIQYFKISFEEKVLVVKSLNQLKEEYKKSTK